MALLRPFYPIRFGWALNQIIVLMPTKTILIKHLSLIYIKMNDKYSYIKPHRDIVVSPI